MRLAARHLVAAEDTLAETVGDADLCQLQFDLAAVGAGGHRDTAGQRPVQAAHRVRRAGNLAQFPIERGIAALAELREPFRRQVHAGARLDQG